MAYGYGYGGWAPYVSAAERRRNAEKAVEKLRKSGHPVAPVKIEGRTIAGTFWGRAWCDNMESYHDYESRLPRGRTYARNGSVVDLQITPGQVTALVSGSDLYRVAITVKATAPAQWRAIREGCAGSISSLVDLLQGKFSKTVMERLCRQDGGLFPRPAEIKFSCSCPDHASMCKHVAAVLYGVGARLDHKPELLFRLRGVNEADLVAGVGAAFSPLSKKAVKGGKALEGEDLSALFGLDMAEPKVINSLQPASVSKERKTDKTITKKSITEQISTRSSKINISMENDIAEPIWKESWGIPDVKKTRAKRTPAASTNTITKQIAITKKTIK